MRFKRVQSVGREHDQQATRFQNAIGLGQCRLIGGNVFEDFIEEQDIKTLRLEWHCLEIPLDNCLCAQASRPGRRNLLGEKLQSGDLPSEGGKMPKVTAGSTTAVKKAGLVKSQCAPGNHGNTPFRVDGLSGVATCDCYALLHMKKSHGNNPVDWKGGGPMET